MCDSGRSIEVNNIMGNLKEPLEIQIPPHLSNDGMVTSPIYHNLSGGDYPRRPPPPIPGANEEAPPALPPRSYQKFTSSKSESYLLAHADQKQKEELKENYNRDNGGTGTGRWDSSGTGTLREDAYAQQLRKQARRFSEQHKPISMQVVSTKATVQVSLSQSYKQEPAPALEAVPVQKHSPSSTSQMMLHHSPTSAQDRKTPEPPPLPTPLKNGETEISEDLNKTADFPPPPSEFLETVTAEEHKDRCADDSYGSYKTRTAPREVGKYKRTTSDSSLLHSHRERKAFVPHADLNSKDVAEGTPNKPPRKKLELQGRASPTQGYRSSSPSMPGIENHSSNQKPASHVPTYQAAEVTSVQHPHKSMARPLHKYASSSSATGSFVSTVVQRPAMNQQERSPTPEDPRTSVRDRVKNIEVFTHSPLSAKGSGQRAQTPTSGRGPASPDIKKEINVADSLEELESSIKSSDSFRDRLRPVVKKSESELTDSNVSTGSVGTCDVTDSVKLSSPPPEIPSRTYRQKPSSQNEPVYRRNSFQKHNAVPRPYENKTNNSANIHNPLNQNNFMNYKLGTGPESMRSPSQSVPEPQVPARLQKSVSGSSMEQSYRDQNSNVPSPDSRLISNHSEERMQVKENTQLNSVQSGQKRNYESSFSRTRTHSGGNSSNSSSNSENRYNDKNVANNHIRHLSNTSNEQTFTDNNSHKNEQRGGHSHRNDFRGDHSFENRQKSTTPDQKLSSRNYNGESHSRRSEVNHFDNHKVPEKQSVSNIQSKDYHSQNEAKESQSHSSNPDKDRQGSHLATVNHGRQASAEEIECDKKAQELAKVLKGSDKVLSDVLTTDSNKIRMQFLDGILPIDSDATEERRPRTGTKSSAPAEENKDKTEDEPTSPMPSNYYVSPPKAMIELEIRKFGDQLTQDIGDGDELAHRKEELLQSLVKKVEVLKHDKKELLVDIDDNETLGKQVQANVDNKCRNQQEKDKYRSYIEDIDKIIRLLLKLSGLLARAENTIQGLTEDTNERIKKMSYDKRDRLYKQHEDAKELKLDIDRRSEQVEAILTECFSESELYEYHQYIKMKSKYTIQMQEMEDKITLGNEQILALQKSIPAKKS